MDKIKDYKRSDPVMNDASSASDKLVILAGLLHDIGKIIRRTGSPKRHEQLSAELIKQYSEVFEKIGVNVDKLIHLIICHHYQRTHEPRCEPPDELLQYLIKADHASAPERLGSKKPGGIITNKLVSPLWVKYYYEKYGGKYSEDEVRRIVSKSRICYEPIPLTSISRYGKSVDIIRKVYKATHCSAVNEEQLKIRYREIVKDIREFLERISELLSKDLLDSETFIDTLTNYLRYALLLVPDDIYWTILPDTSLSSHLILTAAIAYATYKGKTNKIRLGLLDLSGIQAFISSLGKTKGALRQIRGRSILLQLIMRASARYLLDKLGLSSISLVLLRGDNALFILPDREDTVNKFHKAIAEINTSLYEIFHGNIYVSGALSEPFKPEYTMPWSPDHGTKGFSKALLEINERTGLDKYRKLGKISKYIVQKQNAVLNNQSIPEQCDICRITALNNELIHLRNIDANNNSLLKKLPFLKNLKQDEIERICPACLLSHLAGSTAENLEFVVEIEDQEITEELYREITGKTEPKLLPSQPKDIKLAPLPLPGLHRTYILLSIKPGKPINNPCEVWEILRNTLVEIIIKGIIYEYYSDFSSKDKQPRKRINVNILRVNDPPSMLPPKGIYFEKIKIADIEVTYGFANIFINFTSKVTNELDDLGKVSEDLDRYTYISWIKTDIDHMGLTGLYLSGSIGRYMTMSELVNFYTNMIGYRILNYRVIHPRTTPTNISDYAIVVFSGGDDTFIISRYAEGLSYLKHYRSWFRDFFGEIIDKKNDKEEKEELLTLSAGYFISEADYPAYLSYRKVIEKLETAKNEGRNLVDISFLEIGKNVFELIKSKQQIPPLKSMSWYIFENIVDLSIDKEIIEWIKNNRVLSFKIMIMLKNIAETIYMILVNQKTNKTAQPSIENLYKRLAENIIAYSYIYAKIINTSRGKTIKKIMNKVSERLACTPASPKEYIDLFNKNDLKELFKSASAFYRLLHLVQLRIKENI